MNKYNSHTLFPRAGKHSAQQLTLDNIIKRKIIGTMKLVVCKSVSLRAGSFVYRTPFR